MAIINRVVVRRPLLTTNSKEKGRPVLCITGSIGYIEGLNSPSGMAVDSCSGNIYVTDVNNNRVQVVSREGKSLFQFGGKVMMKHPFAIVIFGNKVFVSIYGYLVVYDLNGNLITKFFNLLRDGVFTAFGMAIQENSGDIYVCNPFIHYVHIFDNTSPFTCQFPVRFPKDLCLTKDNIYILSGQDKYLYIFDYNLIRVQNSISELICEHLFSPYSFVIDGGNNIIILEDNYNRDIIIFDKTGNLLGRVCLFNIHSTGVALYNSEEIIVIGYSKTH